MIQLGSRSFELAYENKNGWNFEAFRDRYSDVLDRYDYIVGDWGYNQLRLKGFFREGNPKSTKETCITSLQDYIQEYCNFGCAYFVLERIPNNKKTIDQAIAGQESHKEGQRKQHQQPKEQKEQAHKEPELKELYKDQSKDQHKDKESQPHKEHHKVKDHHKERHGRPEETKAMKPHKDQQKQNKRPHRGDHKRHDRKAAGRHPEAVRTSQAKSDA